jgi:hypothetical protein
MIDVVIGQAGTTVVAGAGSVWDLPVVCAMQGRQRNGAEAWFYEEAGPALCAVASVPRRSRSEH